MASVASELDILPMNRGRGWPSGRLGGDALVLRDNGVLVSVDGVHGERVFEVGLLTLGAALEEATADASEHLSKPANGVGLGDEHTDEEHELLLELGEEQREWSFSESERRTSSGSCTVSGM